MHLKRILAIAIGLAVPVQTWASSDDAWQKLFARANGTCIGQSRMNTPEASAPVVFDDSVGKAKSPSCCEAPLERAGRRRRPN